MGEQNKLRKTVGVLVTRARTLQVVIGSSGRLVHPSVRQRQLWQFGAARIEAVHLQQSLYFWGRGLVDGGDQAQFNHALEVF